MSLLRKHFDLKWKSFWVVTAPDFEIHIVPYPSRFINLCDQSPISYLEHLAINKSVITHKTTFIYFATDEDLINYVTAILIRYITKSKHCA